MSTYPGENPQEPEQQPPADETSDTEPTQPVGYWQRQAAEEAAERAREQGQPHPTTPYPQGYPGGQDPQYPGQASTPQNPYGAAQPGYPPPPPPPAAPQPSPQSWPQPSPATPSSAAPSSPSSPPPGQAGPHPPPPGTYAGAYSGPPNQTPSQPGAYGPPAGGYGPPAGGYGPPPPSSFAAQAAYSGYRAPVPDHPQATLSLVLGLVGLIGAFVFCGLPLVVSPFAWALGRNALKEIRAAQGGLGGESQARTGMILGIIGTVLAVLAVLALVAFIVAVAASEPTTTGSSV